MDEFETVVPGKVRSNLGFVVTTTLGGAVHYEDQTGTFRIDAEWTMNGIMLYRSSRSNEGTATLPVEEIIERTVRALEFQNLKVTL